MPDYNLPEKTSTGTPKARPEWMQENYPELTEKIMEAGEGGGVYDDGSFRWKIDHSPKYGSWVYQNAKQTSKYAGSTSKSYFREKAKEGPKQQQLTDDKTINTDIIAILAVEVRMMNALKIYEFRREGRQYEEIIADLKEIVRMLG